jgi:hypothetical protein
MLKLCIAIMHVRLVLSMFEEVEIFKKDDDVETYPFPRLKVVETIVAGGLMLMNSMMILHCYQPKNGAIFVSIFSGLFMWGFVRKIWGNDLKGFG